MAEVGFGGRQKWLVALAGAARAASGGMLGTALVVYVGRNGSPLAVGLLATTFSVGLMVFSPVWGAIGDALGRVRTLLVAVSVLATTTILGFLLVDGVWPVVGLRGVYAVFAVGFGPLMLSLVGTLSGQEHRGRAAGFYNGSTAAGDVVGQLAVGVLIGAFLPSHLYLFIAVVSLFGAVVLVFVADPAPNRVESAGTTTSGLVSEVTRRVLPDARERRLLRQTGLGWLYLGLTLRHLAVKGIASVVPFYLLSTVGVSPPVMGLLLTVGSAAQVGLMPLAGRVADRGYRKHLVVGGVAVSGFYGVFLAGTGVLTGGAVRILVAVAAFVALAAGFSAMDVGAIAYIGDTVPQGRVSAFVGLRSTAGGIGGVVGPTLVGVLAVELGYPAAFAAVSAFAFLSGVLLFRFLSPPVRATAPDLGYRTIETSTGVARPPGMLRDSEEEEE